MQREAQTPSIWHPLIILEVGRCYIVQLSDEELPKVALLDGWNGEVPIFAFMDRHGEVGGVSALILGETQDPFGEWEGAAH